MLIDDATGTPVPLDYGLQTTRTSTPGGEVASVVVSLVDTSPPPSVRAYLMVDTYPAARATIAIP